MHFDALLHSVPRHKKQPVLHCLSALLCCHRQCLAGELGPSGIRINAIAPGPTDTDALAKTAGAAAEQIVSTLPLGRKGQPDDMLSTCLFLLSDAASWITGQVVNVDGGQIRRP